MLAGVILAGGLSSRMGQDKSLLSQSLNGNNLLEHSVGILKQLDNIHISISGAQHKKGIADLVPNCGPLSGIHAALHYMSAEQALINEAVFVPVDMPQLGPKELTHLIKQGRKLQAVCCFKDHYLPLYVPITTHLIDYLDLQLSFGGEQSAIKNRRFSLRALIKHMGGVEIESQHASSLININTPEQWQDYCQKHSIKG